MVQGIGCDASNIEGAGSSPAGGTTMNAPYRIETEVTNDLENPVWSRLVISDIDYYPVDIVTVIVNATKTLLGYEVFWIGDVSVFDAHGNIVSGMFT